MRATPTAVLMPGLLCDAEVWSGQRAALERLVPVVATDFSHLSSITAMAEKVLDEVSGPLIAIGHSMGGRVTLEVMRRAPERVAGLALLSTGLHTRREGEEARRAALVKIGYEKGMSALAAEWAPPMVDPRRRGDAALLQSMTEMVMRVTPQQHERQIRALLDRPDPRSVLCSISCPTLVLVGRQDQWSPVAQHEEIASLIPRARLVVIENSGHMLPRERPQETAAALSDWLADLMSKWEG